MSPYITAGIAVAWLASMGAAYQHGVSTTRTAWQLDVSERERAASEALRATEYRWRTIIDERVEDAAKAQVDIAADRDAAMRIADGLRDTARKYAAGTCPTTAVAAGSPAAAPACGVLPELLAELEERGRIVAEAADRSRLAGLTCERIADGWAGG